MKMELPAIQIKRLLTIKSKTIAVAESITGGRVQSALTSISGSSNFFLGGITAYNIDQKVKLLGVDREHAANVNCVSRQVANQMVAGTRHLFGSDIGLATTGYAEPWPEENVKQAYAFYAIDMDGQIDSGRIEIGTRSRVAAQEFVATEALQKLVVLLQKS